MIAVMISEHPRWAGMIADGKKTIDVRKSRPKIEPPFKCFIYHTAGGHEWRDAWCTAVCPPSGKIYDGSQKVIGEFVCDRITELEGEFWDDDTYESIGEVWYDEDDGERNVSISVDNGCDNYKANILCRESCVTWEELRRYIGTGINTFYAWHISDLKIYDKPKKLFDFQTPKAKCEHISIYGLCLADSTNPPCEEIICNAHRLTRPPQSWQYVEVPDNER